MPQVVGEVHRGHAAAAELTFEHVPVGEGRLEARQRIAHPAFSSTRVASPPPRSAPPRRRAPAARRSPPSRSSPRRRGGGRSRSARTGRAADRSEEHTSELQSQSNLVCRLLLEK